MNTSLVLQDAMGAVEDRSDHSEQMQADPGRYGFTHSELSVLTAEEMRIGMTKEFLQVRADVRLHQAMKRRQARVLSPAN